MMENDNPEAFVNPKANLSPVNLAPFRPDRIGAGILNADDVAEDSPLELRPMLTPFVATLQNAVRLVKVVTPPTALTAVEPPKFQLPWAAAAVTAAVLLATTLPNVSSTFTTGCTAKVPPSAAGVAGWVVTISCVAVPGTRVCTIELVL